jgi:hypothetical protein
VEAVDLHVTFEPDAATKAVLAQILAGVQLLIQKEAQDMAAIDDLTAAVARQTTVTKSALTLIQNLAAAITAAGTDPAKLAALTAALNANDDELAAAVLANTPAAPATTPA